jgi:RNase P protein component
MKGTTGFLWRTCYYHGYNPPTRCQPNKRTNQRRESVQKPTDSSLALKQPLGARLCRVVVAQGGRASRLPRNLVFPRAQRFPRSGFSTALRLAKKVSSTHFSVIVPHTGLGYAVVVPKKVARLSITRHKVKRHTLEAMKTLRLPPAAIIFPHASVAKMRYDEVVRDLATLFSKLNHP